MTFHQSTFLAVCAPDTMMGSKFWGCGAELLIEQVRGIEGAREAAVANGWTWSRPKPPYYEHDDHLRSIQRQANSSAKGAAE